jgi:hypothetical protein
MQLCYRVPLNKFYLTWLVTFLYLNEWLNSETSNISWSQRILNNFLPFLLLNISGLRKIQIFWKAFDKIYGCRLILRNHFVCIWSGISGKAMRWIYVHSWTSGMFAELKLHVCFIRYINLLSTINLVCPNFKQGQAVAQFVEALRYKLECRVFNSRWWQWNYSLTHSFRPHYVTVVGSASDRNE